MMKTSNEDIESPVLNLSSFSSENICSRRAVLGGERITLDLEQGARALREVITAD